MSVVFYRGQQLGSKDLHICLANESDYPINAAEISYALYDLTTGKEVLLGVPRRDPANDSVGHYYASIVIPKDARIGDYRLRWVFREMAGGKIHQVVQEFNVVDMASGPMVVVPCSEASLVRSLRILLRDNNPDRNYHFRPPAHEETISQYNRVFGYIWEDEELLEYLLRSLDMVSAAPPRTPIGSIDTLFRSYPDWRTLVINGAMMYALLAISINWVAEEFGYSIGGVSLDLNKSAQYETLYQSVKDSFDSQLEKAKATVKIIKGLQQPRYGIGIRSSFGPYVGSGVLSPKKFVGF